MYISIYFFHAPFILLLLPDQIISPKLPNIVLSSRRYKGSLASETIIRLKLDAVEWLSRPSNVGS